jgi:Family of unknown function (DUF5767)
MPPRTKTQKPVPPKISHVVEKEVDITEDSLSESYGSSSASLVDETVGSYDLKDNEVSDNEDYNPSSKILDDSFKDLMNSSKKRPMASVSPNDTKQQQAPPPPRKQSKKPGQDDDDDEEEEDSIGYEESVDDESYEILDDDMDAKKLLDGEKFGQNAMVNDINNTHIKHGIEQFSMSQNVHHQNMVPQETINHFGQANIVQVSDGYETIDEEKVDLLFKLDRLRKKGYQVLKLDDKSSIIEIRKEYNRLKNELELDHSIGFSRKILMAIISTIEFLNKRYDPFDLALDGWSESVMENIHSYDHILERLYYKYKNRVAMPPELELMITLAGSAFMFHMTHSLFKAAVSSGGKNPDLIQSMMNAFTNIASQSMANSKPGAPQQPPAQQQYNSSPQVQHQPPPPPPQSPVPQWNSPPQQQQPAEGGAPYKMKGPDFDISSLTGGVNPMNILPGLSSLLGGSGLNLSNLNLGNLNLGSLAGNSNAPVPPVQFVNPNPVPSDTINMPQRRIEVEDERFNAPSNSARPFPPNSMNGPIEANRNDFMNHATVTNADINMNRPPPPQTVVMPPQVSNANNNVQVSSNAAMRENNNNSTIKEKPKPTRINMSPPILPDPPLLNMVDTQATMSMPTPLTDDERLSDINSEDLESIKTDALSTVLSESDMPVSKTVKIGASSSGRMRQRRANQAASGKPSGKVIKI